MPHIGLPEWIIIFLVVLVIFGPKALPKIGQSIGQGIRELKDALSGVSKEIESEEDRKPRIENSVARGTSGNTADTSSDGPKAQQ